MDDFFDDMDMELALNSNDLPTYGLQPPTIQEEAKTENSPKPQADHRTIRRCGAFNVTESPEGFPVLDNGYLTICEKLGTGTFCKVKKAVA